MPFLSRGRGNAAPGIPRRREKGQGCSRLPPDLRWAARPQVLTLQALTLAELGAESAEATGTAKPDSLECSPGKGDGAGIEGNLWKGPLPPHLQVNLPKMFLASRGPSLLKALP